MPKKNQKEKIIKNLQEKVTVHLVKDDYRYTDDVTVTYNGTNYQIKRGVPVQVPKFVKMILDDSFRQQSEAADFSKSLENRFYEKTDAVAHGKKA